VSSDAPGVETVRGIKLQIYFSEVLVSASYLFGCDIFSVDIS